MRLKRRATRVTIVSILMGMLMSLGLVATSSGTAHATSAYDDVMYAKQSAQIPNWTDSQWKYLDASSNWYDYIQAGTAKDSLDDARDNGGHWMLVDLSDNLSIIWSTDPSVSTSFFDAYGQPSWGIASGSSNTWNVIRLTAQDGVVSQTSFLNQAGRNIIYLGNKPSPIPRTGLVFSTYPNVGTSGYVGDPIPTELPPAAYVAMGDSYSSGEGNPSFEAGTATGTDKCHRSPVAYPRLLNSALNLGAMAFVACSGATTSNVLHGGSADGAWGENPQIDALSDDTEVVTITIGGNDVGFTDYAIACTEMLCGPSTFDYSYIMGAINDSDFFDDLEETYESILTHAPNAQIYVSGYPFLAAEDSDVCGAVDLTGAWAVQDQLNEVTEDAVEDVQSTLLTARLHYVDPNQTGSPFIGKHLCNGGASDFNGLMSPVSYSLHPNADGHEDFESVFANVIS